VCVCVCGWVWLLQGLGLLGAEQGCTVRVRILGLERTYVRIFWEIRTYAGVRWGDDAL
jgi:hypothetical protein